MARRMHEQRRKDMALDVTIFRTMLPSRFITFTIPNPSDSPQVHLLRVAVLDSPLQLTQSPPRVAALFVPKNLESDWIFSTESGHVQLLLGLPDLSRLILVGDQPFDGSDPPVIYRRPVGDRDRGRLELSLKPLLMALSPKVCLESGNYEVPFLTYENNVTASMVLEKCVGSCVGEMLVEDVEIEIDGETSSSENKREFRRRLRFKRMPNLVQTDMKIVPAENSDSTAGEIGRTEFNPDVSILVHPYLAPMVAGLALISSHVDWLNQTGSKPKALCVGVGGGALLSFLRTRLDFKVTGVDIDQEVIRVARQYFGFEEDDELTQVRVGDGIKFLMNLSCKVDSKFDVVMVDLDSRDARNGMSAPPLEFVRKRVLRASREGLSRPGALIVNVIPLNRSFYDTLIDNFREVFPELYQINVGNGENFVLIAMVSPVEIPSEVYEAPFLKRLRSAIPREHVDSIKRI